MISERQHQEILVDDLLRGVKSELLRAMSKFDSFNSAHEGYAVILEELDELWDEVKANDLNNALDEAVQVAAMAVRFILDLSVLEAG